MRTTLPPSPMLPKGCDVEAFDVRGKLVVIRGLNEVNEQIAHHLATKLKRAGAIELIFIPSDTSFEALDDATLKLFGLCRLAAR